MGRYICTSCRSSLDAGETRCPTCGSTARRYISGGGNRNMSPAKVPEHRTAYYVYNEDALVDKKYDVNEARRLCSSFENGCIELRLEIAK